MTKTQTLKWVNNKIDSLILKGKTNSKEYKRLIQLHLALTK